MFSQGVLFANLSWLCSFLSGMLFNLIVSYVFPQGNIQSQGFMIVFYVHSGSSSPPPPPPSPKKIPSNLNIYLQNLVCTSSHLQPLFSFQPDPSASSGALRPLVISSKRFIDFLHLIRFVISYSFWVICLFWSFYTYCISKDSSLGAVYFCS